MPTDPNNEYLDVPVPFGGGPYDDYVNNNFDRLTQDRIVSGPIADRPNPGAWAPQRYYAEDGGINNNGVEFYNTGSSWERIETDLLTVAVENITDVQSALDDAEAAGGGRVALSEGVHLLSGPIDVRPNTTLELRDGCILEPGTKETMIQLRASGTGTDAVGRVLGPGMLRTRPDELMQSTLADFDATAHILVDGTDDIRPSHNTTRGLASRVVDGVHIRADPSATGGYGIHLACLNDSNYIWLLDFVAHTFGCEHAIRLESTAATTASINGNRFYGTYFKPIRIINGLVGDPTANRISHNEFRGTAQASTAMDEMYHIEGREWQRAGTDFDIDRPTTYVFFGADSQGNYIGPATLGLIPGSGVVDNGTRNVVTVAAEREFDSRVFATLSADQSLPAGGYRDLQCDTTGTDDVDAGEEWDDSTHTYTAATRGTVAVAVHTRFGGTAAGDALLLRILHNNTPIWTDRTESPGGGDVSLDCTTGIRVGRNDTIRAAAFASNGATLNSQTDQTAISIHKTG